MVWHLPHLQAIARACPEGAVTVLTKRRSRADELFDGSAFVRQVLWLERAQSGEARGRHDGALGAWRLAADIRPHRFDTVWILHDSPRYALAALLARVPLRIGFGTGRQRRFLSDRVILPRADRHLPTVEKATRLLGLHGIAVEPTPGFRPAAAATARVLAEHGGRPRPWLGLGVGSSESFKQWGVARFAELAARFAGATGGTVFAIGGPAERDAVEAVRAAGGPAVVATIGLPLGDAAALAGACDAVAGNDTGLLNLAAATGVPAIGLFGGSPPLTHYPNLVAIEPPGGARYRVDRMAEIPVVAVAEAIAAALAAGPARAERSSALQSCHPFQCLISGEHFSDT
jgi:heptosyltransferase-2